MVLLLSFFPSIEEHLRHQVSDIEEAHIHQFGFEIKMLMHQLATLGPAPVGLTAQSEPINFLANSTRK